MPTPDLYLTRARANLGQALAEGATITDTCLALVLVTRGINSASDLERADAEELAEFLGTINGFREGPGPGEVAP